MINDEMTSDRWGRSTKSWNWLAVVFAMVLPSLVTLAYFVWAKGLAAGAQQATYSIAKAVQFAFPLFWMALVQRQRLRFNLFSSRGVALGVGFGLIVFFAGVVLYHTWLKTSEFFLLGQQPIRDKVAELGINQPWQFIALGVFYSLCHSLLEEYYWRWFVFAQLKSLLSCWPAATISALGFMAHHVIVLGTYFGFFSLSTWLFSLAVACGGFFWAWLYHRSESLLAPWLSHLLIDAAIFTIGYHMLM
ncbi:MAG: CPBP family glutamic-type intramembrane protease [Pirellulales bacterium]|nr:CPBP family glutamic-type intramembrane protease [Pirellulales bacterium]